MSLVLAYIDSNSKTHMLSDSCWTLGSTGVYNIEPKVEKFFIKQYSAFTGDESFAEDKTMMIGFTGSMSVFQYLKYAFEFPEKYSGETIEQYIYRSFTEKIASDEIMKTLISNQQNLELIISIEGKLYILDSELNFFESKNNYAIAGFSSETFSIVFEILEKVGGKKITDENFKEVFEKTIEIIASISAMVAPPFNWGND